METRPLDTRTTSVAPLGLRQAQGKLSVRTNGQGLFEITPEVAAWLAHQHFESGLLTVFCQHTSASLIIQENADPDVRRDLQTFFGGWSARIRRSIGTSWKAKTTCRRTFAAP